MSKQKIVRFDWAIKHLLRNKANYDIIEGFLCALLNDNNLEVLELIESEGNQNSENDKFNRVDVLIKDGHGRKIIIEIQNTKESDYLERILFGTSKTVVESIELGKAYKNISKVISVSILYFNLGIGDDYLYYGETIFKGLNTKDEIERVKTLLPGKERFSGINKFPEYYLIQVEKYKNIISHAIDEWIYWFKNEQIAENSKSKHIDKVSEKLSYLKMSVQEKKAYEYYMDRLVSEIDMIETAKNTGRKKAEKTFRAEIEKVKASEETQRRKKEEAEKKKEEAEKKKEEAEREKEKAEKKKEEAEREKEEAENSLNKAIIQLWNKDMSVEQIASLLSLSMERVEQVVSA